MVKIVNINVTPMKVVTKTRDGTGWDGTGRDGTGRDGMGRDGTGRLLKSGLRGQMCSLFPIG